MPPPRAYSNREYFHIRHDSRILCTILKLIALHSQIEAKSTIRQSNVGHATVHQIPRELWSEVLQYVLPYEVQLLSGLSSVFWQIRLVCRHFNDFLLEYTTKVLTLNITRSVSTCTLLRIRRLMFNRLVDLVIVDPSRCNHRHRTLLVEFALQALFLFPCQIQHCKYE